MQEMKCNIVVPFNALKSFICDSCINTTKYSSKFAKSMALYLILFDSQQVATTVSLMFVF